MEIGEQKQINNVIFLFSLVFCWCVRFRDIFLLGVRFRDMHAKRTFLIFDFLPLITQLFLQLEIIFLYQQMQNFVFFPVI